MKKTKLILAAITALVLYGTTSIAQEVTYPYYKSDNIDPLTVKYVGTDGNYLLFSVAFKPTTAKNASFKIEDSSEGQLFSSNVNKLYNVQLLKIEKQENQELEFKLIEGKNAIVKTFKYDTESNGVVNNDNAFVY